MEEPPWKNREDEDIESAGTELAETSGRAAGVPPQSPNAELREGSRRPTNLAAPDGRRMGSYKSVLME